MAPRSDGGRTGLNLAGGLFYVVVMVLTFGLLAFLGCMPDARADVKDPALVLAAQGDSVRATLTGRSTGNPDSVVVLFSMPNAPTVRIKGTAATTSFGPAILVPVPAIVEGDSATVVANWTAYKKGTASVSGAIAKVYKRPVTPPNFIPDSLNVSAITILGDRQLLSMVNGQWHDVQQTNTSRLYCVAFTFKDNGKIALRTPDRADTTCARYYATGVGQLQRAQAVTYVGTPGVPGGYWAVGPYTVARQAAIDRVCIGWSTTDPGGHVDPESCNSGASRELQLARAGG